MGLMNGPKKMLMPMKMRSSMRMRTRKTKPNLPRLMTKPTRTKMRKRSPLLRSTPMLMKPPKPTSTLMLTRRRREESGDAQKAKKEESADPTEESSELSEEEELPKNAEAREPSDASDSNSTET